MAHTYLPSTPYTPGPTIIMTTNPASRKTAHLTVNPRVSLLVHDWVSPRDDSSSNTGSERARRWADENDAAQRRRPSSSLASMLLGFNRAALGRISVTVAGTARVLARGGAEERWCRSRHVENHGFKGTALAVEEGDEDPQSAADVDGVPPDALLEEGFLAGEDVRVVVVQVQDGRIADWKGGITDFVVRSGDAHDAAAATATTLTNRHVVDGVEPVT